MEGSQSRKSRSQGNSGGAGRRGAFPRFPFPSPPSNREGICYGSGNSSNRGGKSRGRLFLQDKSPQVWQEKKKKGSEEGLPDKEKSLKQQNLLDAISPTVSNQLELLRDSSSAAKRHPGLSSSFSGLKIRAGVPATETTASDATEISLSDHSLEVEVPPEQFGSSKDFNPAAKDCPLKERFQSEVPGGLGNLVQKAVIEPFDICLQKACTPVMLKPSLLVQNKERRNEAKRAVEGHIGKILRPGMVLLKNYLSINDQVKIVKLCRDLGVGPGGFYQPGYQDGRRLQLKMMCLGRNWDPEASEYRDHRPFDGAVPPKIPPELCQWIDKAIEDSHALIEKSFKANNVDDILPPMSPNICIVNFYSASGRLGLHQDKDESQESLHKGLPVVSFSIGDSAEFLFGDQREVEKAEKVVLESGDVLLFGGKSRHIFHGVSSIISKTAPRNLLKETYLRPGRLNLTFREY